MKWAFIFRYLLVITGTLVSCAVYGEIYKPGKKPGMFYVQTKIGIVQPVYSDFYQGNASDSLLVDRIDNRITEINNAYSNQTNYGGKKIISNFKFDNDIQFAVPLSFDVGIELKYFLFEVGFSYFLTKTNVFSYDLTTGPATVRTADSSRTLNSDIHENANLDNTYVPEAYGLTDSGGVTTTVFMFQSASRYEIPFSILMKITPSENYQLNLGLGGTFYHGSIERAVYVGNHGIPDIDRFSGSAFGFHFIIRGKYKIAAQISLLLETKFNFAISNSYADEVLTGAGTVDSLFHLNKNGDFGGNEIPAQAGQSTATNPVPGVGNERFATLDFTGITFNAGLCYRL